MRRSASFGFIEKLALLGAIGLIASPAVKGILYRWRLRHPAAMREAAVDESLEDTFPASDPVSVAEPAPKRPRKK